MIARFSRVCAVSLCLQAGTAMAQQASPPQTAPTDSQSSDNTLDDIVVTAQHRSENLQNVPIAVTAYSGEKLQAAGVTDSVQIQQLVPGLVINKTFSGANPYLRAVGNVSSGVGNDPAVATYIDDLYIPNAAAGLFALNNIDHIEVLKGPQGTLFGRNALGGVIHIITKQPSVDPEVDASIGYGNYNTISGDLYATAGLSEKLAFSVAGTYSDQRDGWGKNLFTGNDAYRTRQAGVMAKAKFSPTDRTDITLSYFYNDVKTDAGLMLGVVPGSVGTDGSTYLGRYTFNQRSDALNKTQQNSFGLHISQDLGSVNLTSITGYHKTDLTQVDNQSGILGKPVAGQGAANQIFDVGERVFTEELRLRSDTGSRLEWMVGGFYLHDILDYDFSQYGTCVGTVCAPTPVPLRTLSRQVTNSYAAFGQLTLNVTKTTRVTGGLRYTSDTRALSGTVQPLAGLPNSPATLPAGTVVHPGDPFAGNPNGIPTKVTWPKLTFRASIDQKLSKDLMVYASFNRGFKSGIYSVANFTNPPAAPEVVDAYEVGLKSELFGRTLRFNTAAFYYDYSNIQLRTSAAPAPPGQIIVFNAAKGRIKGIDVDFEWEPVNNLVFTGGAEALDAKFVNFPGGQCIAPRPITGTTLGGTVTTVCDRSGAKMPRAPKFTGVIGAQYKWQVGFGSLTINVKDSYSSSYYFDPSNRIKQDAYHLLNSTLTWDSSDKRYWVQLWARNLFNKFTFAQVYEGGGGTDNYAPGEPRTYGVKMGVHF